MQRHSSAFQEVQLILLKFNLRSGKNSTHAHKPEENHSHSLTPKNTNAPWLMVSFITVSFASFSWVSHHAQGTPTHNTIVTQTTPSTHPTDLSLCAISYSRIMTSQALLPCRLCLTQFLQQPPCVSGKMDSVRQQQWFMGNCSTSEEVRRRGMNLWQIGEREKRDREREKWGGRNAYEKEQ